jgi:hypothetical protein
MPPLFGDDDGVAGSGVSGSSNNGGGVRGLSIKGRGVVGESLGPSAVDAVVGITQGGSDTWWAAGVVGVNENSGQGAWAGFFTGKVYVSQGIYASNVLSKIDHPIDPANKYLYHSSVESPDLKNLYDGMVTLDGKGEAVIELPDWFRALNKDLRYQLTAIGAPGPNLYIAKEISDAGTNNKGHFKIAGGTSGMKVSWQVTGVRNDLYSRANPFQIEVDKSDMERGLYIHPEVYGRAAEKRITLDNLRKSAASK